MNVETNTGQFRPRGTEVSLPHGGLPEAFPPYLQDLISRTGGAEGPIGLQFIARPDLEHAGYEGLASDPLMEDHHEVAPGLVYKYRAGRNENEGSTGRALWTITRNCAAYCRFCTRGREVGIPARLEGKTGAALAHNTHLSKEKVDESLEFIRNEQNLNEVILSGGDPLTVRPDVLRYVLGSLGNLQRAGKLDTVRVGTRLPIHNPFAVKDHHLEAVGQLENPRLMIHINHPLELTNPAKEVLRRFRKESGAVIMTQSVLLRGVNDSVKTLEQLFNTTAKEGMVPYYVYQNDPVYWAEHFTVPLSEAIEIWKQLRPRLSGIAATARLVIDTPNGYGKIPLPEGDAWEVNYGQGYKDFKGKRHPLK